MRDIKKRFPSVALFSFLIFLLAACGSSGGPTENTLKADLVGKKITDGVQAFVCESPAELTKFNITAKDEKGGVARYTIEVGAGNAQTEATALVTMEYRKEGSDWKLADLKATSVAIGPRK